MTSSRTSRSALHRSRTLVVGAALLSMLAVGCSSGDEPETTGSATDEATDDAIDEATDAATDDGTANASVLPAEIRIPYLQDLTGPASGAGVPGREGAEIAVQQIEESGLLGDSKIVLEFEDTASTVDQAVTLMSQATASDAIAILGPPLSSEAVAMSPIAVEAGVPFIVTQAGSDGVVDAGEYVFRVTMPQPLYQDVLVDHLVSEGVETVSYIYNNAIPTVAGLVEDVHPPLLEDAGIEVLSTSGYQTGASDFSALVSNVIEENPDAVGAMSLLAESSPLVTQLRNAGYEGLIFGNQAFDGGALEGAGELAAGAVWATDFHPDRPADQTATFVDAYEQEFGRTPNNFAAESYDAMWFLARGLAGLTDEYSRDALRDSLEAVSDEGFEGAMGSLEFEDRDLRIDAVLVMWDGSETILAG